MPQHHSHVGGSGATRERRTRRAGVAGVAVAALVILGSGLAACGDDDDDAAGTTDASTSSTTPGVATTDVPETSVPDSAPTSDAGAPAGGSTVSSDAATDAATDTATATEGTTAEADAALAAGSAPAGDTTPGGSGPDAGPTTTGPACEFAENTAFPIERCNMGPPVAVIQSILQANQYAVTAIDGEFGDETVYAVRAFQEAEGLTVDGLVGAETWAALDVPETWGDDNNGNGTIEPDEIDLANVGT